MEGTASHAAQTERSTELNALIERLGDHRQDLDNIRDRLQRMAIRYRGDQPASVEKDNPLVDPNTYRDKFQTSLDRNTDLIAGIKSYITDLEEIL